MIRLSRDVKIVQESLGSSSAEAWVGCLDLVNDTVATGVLGGICCGTLQELGAVLWEQFRQTFYAWHSVYTERSQTRIAAAIRSIRRQVTWLLTTGSTCGTAKTEEGTVWSAQVSYGVLVPPERLGQSHSSGSCLPDDNRSLPRSAPRNRLFPGYRLQRHQPTPNRPERAKAKRSVLPGSGTLVTRPCIRTPCASIGLSHV